MAGIIEVVLAVPTIIVGAVGTLGVAALSRENDMMTPVELGLAVLAALFFVALVGSALV